MLVAPRASAQARGTAPASAVDLPPLVTEPRTTSVVVEIDSEVDEVAGAKLTRRMIALEVADVTMQPPPGSTENVVLFYRVLMQDEGSLRIELWERGVSHGFRTISASEGSRRLQARRVALAADVLARSLQRSRAAEVERAVQAREPQPVTEPPGGIEMRGRLRLLPEAKGAVVGPGDWLLAGPGVRGRLQLDSGARVDVGAAWLFGSSPATDDGARWLELSVSPGWTFSASDALELSIELTAAAAAVHLEGVRGVDDTAGEGDSWSARTTLGARLEPKLADSLRLSVGPEAGVALRRVVVVDERGQRERLGGVWLGLGAGLVLGK